MSSVDDRIVAMKFENKQFESGIASSLTSLDKLKAGMNFSGAIGTAQKSIGAFSSVLGRFGLTNPFATATSGVGQLQRATNGFSTTTIEGGITGVSRSFIAMSTVAITALSTITRSAMEAGQNLASAFTIDPIRSGLQEYEATLASTQTLMSGTGESVEEVTATLKELNDYSDRTIYSFSDMTKNITAFTNAGMGTKKASAVMQGITNAAASAGISADQAAAAMRGFGQSMSMGYVGLADWNQVDNSQLATKEFKNELIASGVAAGTLTKRLDGTTVTAKGTVVNFKNLRSTLHEQWLSAEAVTDTLGRYSDVSTDVGKKAAANATRVKDLTQTMGILKETSQSGWSETWLLMFGNLEEATKLWTGVNEEVGGFIQRSAEARNKVVGDWKELGGRTMLIEAIGDVWKGLLSVLTPIKDAFRDIFPAQTGATLFALTEKFAEFAEGLTIGKETAENLKRTFSGVFAIFSIAGQIIGGVVDMFQRLFGAIGKGSGGFLDFTGGIGDFLVSIDIMLKQSGLVTAFFQGLGSVLAVPIKFLAMVASFIGKLFTGFDAGTAGQVEGALGAVGDRLEPLTSLAESVQRAFKGLGRMIGEAMRGIGDAIAESFGSGSFDKSLDVINTGLLAGIVLMLKNFMSGSLISFDLGGGLFDSIKETLGSVTGALEGMQARLKADVLIKIAGALAILTASLVVLSLIDSEKMNQALTAMGLGFIALQVSLSALVATINGFGAAKLPFIAAGMVGIASAMLILSGALKILSTIKPAELARGMAAMAGMMFILTKAVGPLSANSKGMIAASVGLIAIATALIIMSEALKAFAEMDYETMARGLVGAAGSLAILAGAMHLMPKNIAIQAVAILILSGALKVMAQVVKTFAEMDYSTMLRGLIGVAGSFALIAAAMYLMPKDMLLQAIALTVVAAALHVIQSAVAKFADMTMEEIATGLIALAGSLLVLAGGLYLMTGSIAGAAALVIAAAALTLLVPVLVALGAMSWESIVKGLAALAGVFLVLGIAGAVIGPVVLIIMGLAASVLLIGAGFALAGAGALMFAAAFGIVVAAGAAGIAVLTGLLKVLITAIPKVMKAFGEGLIEMIKVIGKSHTEMVNAFSSVISALLDAVIKNVPKMAKAFMIMLDAGLDVISTSSPRIFAAGIEFILGFMEAIDKNIYQMVTLATNIAVNFIDGLTANQDRIIDAGVRFIISFINGTAEAIDKNSYAMGQAGGKLAAAIVEGMIKGMWGGVTAIHDAAVGVAKAALDAAKDFLGIKSPSKEFEKIGKFVDEGFAKGLKGGEDQVLSAMTEMADKLKGVATSAAADVEALKGKLSDLKDDKKPNTKAIEAIKKQLEAAKELATQTKSAHEQFMKGSLAERQALFQHGQAYDTLTEKIKVQRDELQDLIDMREAEASSIASQYGAAPDMTGTEEDPVTPEEYSASLATKAAETEKFMQDLAMLRSMGMDDVTYRKLLEEGLDAQPFVAQMLAGGSDMVQAIAFNQSMLTMAAANLGHQAAGDMHNAGIEIQRGIVTGLESDLGILEAAMEKIATKMIKALRKKLKIKSPSREFMTIGKFADEGLADGLKKYSSVAEEAAAGVGGKALDTLKTSMSKVSDGVDQNIDFNPTVAPVLDLSQLQKQATKISGILATDISPNLSLDQAGSIAANTQAAQDAAAALADAQPTTREIRIEQTNNSPKAISAAESYRNTRSALQLAKEALDKP